MSTSSSSSDPIQEPLPRRALANALSALAGWPLRRVLDTLMRNVHCSSLVLDLPGGGRTEARGAIADPHAAIRLHRWRSLLRMQLQGEAVGERYWPVYFETLRQRLKPEGIAVLQVITIADAQFDHYRRNADFIQRYIFPGGMLPSPSAMAEQASRAGFTIEKCESFGDSYAETLVEWRRRFLRAWPRIEALGFDASFKRLWEYYLCYCEAGFRAGRVDVGLYRLRLA